MGPNEHGAASMTSAAAYAQRVRAERARFRAAQQLAETEQVIEDILQAPAPIKPFVASDEKPNATAREAAFLVTLVSLGLETLDEVRASIELTEADARRLGAHATPAMLVRIEESRNLRREVLREFDKLIAKSEANDGRKTNNRASQFRVRRLRKKRRNYNPSVSRRPSPRKDVGHFRTAAA